MRVFTLVTAALYAATVSAQGKPSTGRRPTVSIGATEATRLRTSNAEAPAPRAAPGRPVVMGMPLPKTYFVVGAPIQGVRHDSLVLWSSMFARDRRPVVAATALPTQPPQPQESKRPGPPKRPGPF